MSETDLLPRCVSYSVSVMRSSRDFDVVLIKAILPSFVAPRLPHVNCTANIASKKGLKHTASAAFACVRGENQSEWEGGKRKSARERKRTLCRLGNASKPYWILSINS